MDAKPVNSSPRGMESYDLGGTDDLGALSNEQQLKLNIFKIKTREENEEYLRTHPEIDSLLSGFLQVVLDQRPENIREFAAEYFTDEKLPARIQQLLEEKQNNLKTHRSLKRML